ncbi:MAG: hypothetical protein JWM95_674 [Gemmatimonadetes bacterium]|nr:hypothetical protein [Gemmatimonadota bacterium]
MRLDAHRTSGRRSFRGCLLASLLCVVSCENAARNLANGKERSIATASYPNGTVGAAASAYVLTIERVRDWYSIAIDIRHEVQQTHQLISLDFPFESALGREEEKVNQVGLVADILRRRGITAREFVVLTASVGTLRVAAQLQDSLGEKAWPENVDPSAKGFVQQHRVELQDLERTLRVP